MRVLGFCLAVMAAIPAVGCGSDVPDSQVNGVFPANGFIGRKVRVEVSGDISEWSNAATVSFGEGITVDSVAVASPSALFADITIADTAPVGLRDVTVTDGGDALTLAAAFSVESSITLQVDGTAAQGSIAFFTIKNNDPFNPFDATSTGDGFFSPLVFTNLSITGPAGVEFAVQAVDPFSASGSMTIDVDAAASGSLQVTSGATDVVVSTLGEAFTVTPRTATVLASGVAAGGNVAAPFDTQLFEFTSAAGPSVADFSVTASSPDVTPSFILLPASGHFADLVAFGGGSGQVIETGTQKFYAIYFDNSGDSNYTVSLKAKSTALTTQAEVEPNNLPATAKVATFASLVNASTLTADTDEDWYKITVAAGDIGKSVRVVTSGSDPLTDSVVEVFSDATGTNSLGGESENSNFFEDFTSTAIPVGTTTVTVKVSADQTGFFDPAHNAYIVAIFLQ